MSLHLAFFSDSTVLGGHEVMCLEAVRQLLRQGRHTVHFVHWQGNTRLHTALQDIQREHAGLQLHPTPVRVLKANVFTAILHRPWLRLLANLFAHIGCHMVVLAQGRIENSTAGALAARRLGLPVISYIPMAHTLAQMGQFDAWGLREWVLGLHYRLPTGYITISEAMAQQVRHYVPHAPLRVVCNPLMHQATDVLPRGQARQRMALPEQGCLLGLVGRIDFVQKGHDLLLDAMVLAGAAWPDAQVVVVGEGADEARLHARIQAAGLGERVLVRPFQPGMATLVSAFDALVMPSRYEGMPLSMMEALQAGVPVLASNRDGMRDVLPAEWQFDPVNPQNAVAVLQREVPQLARQSERARQLAAQVPSAEAFGLAFEQALLALQASSSH